MGLRIFRKRRIRVMYTILFVIGIAIFGYLMYVLIRPEKF
ncbi:K(+)-transporting ATPase subunit F [Bacteroides salyersiae]|nr:K(+)-transporting ATPase subunit F [Bacteroides salyersiae]MBV4202855.1 K(+)-transporting ATPase subunit F [Bacteroides salyersiae]UBD18161.1 K(+)-transporting ATPase subunit F [Bacteroides salyersiae]